MIVNALLRGGDRSRFLDHRRVLDERPEGLFQSRRLLHFPHFVFNNVHYSR